MKNSRLTFFSDVRVRVVVNVAVVLFWIYYSLHVYLCGHPGCASSLYINIVRAFTDSTS